MIMVIMDWQREILGADICLFWSLITVGENLSRTISIEDQTEMISWGCKWTRFTVIHSGENDLNEGNGLVACEVIFRGLFAVQRISGVIMYVHVLKSFQIGVTLVLNELLA